MTHTYIRVAPETLESSTELFDVVPSPSFSAKSTPGGFIKRIDHVLSANQSHVPASISSPQSAQPSVWNFLK